MFAGHRRQPDGLLEDRAPGRAGDPPHLATAREERHRDPCGHGGHGWGKILRGVDRFDAGPVDLQSHQPSGRTAVALLGLQRRLPHEVVLVEGDEVAQDPQLERRVSLLCDQGVPRAGVVDL